LEQAQRIAHVGWWERDLRTGRVSLSEEACRIFGVQPVDLPEWHSRWLQAIHPEDRAKAAEAAAAALVKGGPRYDVEYRVVRSDGVERIVHSQGDVTWDESGRPLRQFGVMQDITELRQAERELRSSEARFRTFVDNATDSFFLLDDASTVLDVNRKACESLSYSREELIGKHRSEFDIDLDETSIQAMKRRTVAGEAVTFETRHRRKDGTTFPVEIRVGQFDQGGRRFLCLARDVTQRKRAEDELRASEARFRTFVDHAIDAFFLHDEDSTVLDANRQACESLGYTRDELIGMSPADFDPDVTPAFRQEARERLDAGEVVTFETRHRRKDGTTFPVEVRIRKFPHGTRKLALSLVRDITDRKRAEEDLRASEARFRTFADHATDAFFLQDEDSTVLDVNRQACESLGYTRDELIGMKTSDLDPNVTPAFRHDMRKRFDAGQVVTFESRHRRKDGTTFPVELRLRRFHQGDRKLVISLVRDISDRKRADEDLRASEARFRTFVDYATDAFFLYAENASVLDVNREACESLGYTRDELIGMTPFEFGPDLTPEMLQRIRERLRAGRTLTYEGRHRRKDGTFFPVEIRIREFRHGDRWLALSLVRDISQRKRAQDELRASEERFRTLVQFSFDVYWETDEQHRFVRQEFADRLADAPAEGSEIGKTRWEVPYVEPDAEAWRKHRETLDAHLPFRDFELARPTSDGGKRYVSVSGLPVFDASGRFVGYRGVGRHITERKKAEEALRRSQAYLAEAQRLSHTGTIAFTETEATYWSDESYRIWGFDPLEGLPSRDTVLQRIHPDDRDRVDAEAEAAFQQRRAFVTEFRIALPDGTVKHIQATGHPSFSAGGDIVEMVATHVDVTERKRAQEEHERLRQVESQLAHVNRVSVMGELAASLAHELLHPIATARNNARAGMRFLELTPPNLMEVKEALACVVRDADRAKDIVGRMRDHIKKAPPRRESFDLNDAIREVIATVRSAIDQNRVSVRTNLTETLDPVHGDRVQLQQVVLNLILNAVEAMISAEGARELSISTKPIEPGKVLVAVADSGPGIGPEHLERVFSPFYTTKSDGMGMGLSICRSIVAAHGGRLWAEASRPRGAIFKFTLPAGLED
jgi:PAS domain S-box-containing protein